MRCIHPGVILNITILGLARGESPRDLLIWTSYERFIAEKYHSKFLFLPNIIACVQRRLASSPRFRHNRQMYRPTPHGFHLDQQRISPK
jgi:hypothetical protein